MAASEAEVAAFVSELNQTFPSLDLKLTDISLVHRGIVPAIEHRNGHVSLQGHEQIRDHAGDGMEGILSVAGVKYTTARGVAERIIDRVLTKLQQAPVPCRTAAVPLPGGGLRDVGLAIGEARRDYDAGLPSDTIPHLIAAYGTRFPEVLAVADARPDWRTRLAHDSPVIGAELVWAVRHEMAVTLCDAVVRRTSLGALGYPGDAAAEKSAGIVGTELKWAPDRIRDELAALRRFYAPL